MRSRAAREGPSIQECLNLGMPASRLHPSRNPSRNSSREFASPQGNLNARRTHTSLTLLFHSAQVGRPFCHFSFWRFFSGPGRRFSKARRVRTCCEARAARFSRSRGPRRAVSRVRFPPSPTHETRLRCSAFVALPTRLRCSANAPSLLCQRAFVALPTRLRCSANAPSLLCLRCSAMAQGS